MKKLISFFLVLALTVCLLSGCGSNKIEALAGTWSATFADDESEALSVLESVDAYPEEIALADLGSLEYAKTYVFNDDMSYSFYLDPQSTKACVVEFFQGFFADLYAGRDALKTVYEADISAMSQEEFHQFYADIYGYADYDALIDALAENVYDYEKLKAPYETGTFSFDGNKLMCTISGESISEAVAYSISADGTTLTLTFADATEVFTKAAG